MLELSKFGSEKTKTKNNDFLVNERMLGSRKEFFSFCETNHIPILDQLTLKV